MNKPLTIRDLLGDALDLNEDVLHKLLLLAERITLDQWASLVGGEPVQVINASSEGTLQFRLPQMIVDARTQIGRDRFQNRLRIVGVTVDAAKRTLAMIWNTAIPCNGRDTQVQASTLRITQMSGVVA